MIRRQLTRTDITCSDYAERVNQLQVKGLGDLIYSDRTESSFGDALVTAVSICLQLQRDVITESCANNCLNGVGPGILVKCRD